MGRDAYIQVAPNINQHCQPCSHHQICREAFSNCKRSKSASDRFLTLVLQLRGICTTCQSLYVLHSRNHIISGKQASKQASRSLLACLLACLLVSMSAESYI